MAVEFGEFPRQEGLGELLGDLVCIANANGRWGRISNTIVDREEAGTAVTKLRRFDVLGIDPDRFEFASVNNEVWARHRG